MGKVLKNDGMFLIPFGIWGYFSIFQKSLLFNKVDFFYVPLSLLCMGLIFIHEIMFVREYKRKDIVAALITLFCMYISFQLKEGTVMYSCFCVYCARHTEFRKIAVTCLAFCSLGLMTIIGASQTGIIKDVVLVPGDGRIRHYLGFLYTLEAPAIFFNICALIVYLRKRAIKWLEVSLLLVLNFILYKFTDSRLSFYFTDLLLVFALLLKYKYEVIVNIRILKSLMTASILLSMVVAFTTTMMYSKEDPFLSTMDSHLEHRLTKGKNSIRNNGFCLFENNIDYQGNGLDINGEKVNVTDNYVDCFYIQYAQRYGLIFFGLIIGLYTYMLHKMKKINEIYILTIFSLFALHGIIDDLVFTLYYNSFLLLGSYLLNFNYLKQ